METDCGRIILDRADGTLATLAIEGQPDRQVALKRRDTAELIAEELRRLDPDETYAAALRYGVDRLYAAADASHAFGEASSPDGAAPSGEEAGSGADAEAVAVPEEDVAKGPAKRAAKRGPAVKRAAAK
jgi:hypothetical protein